MKNVFFIFVLVFSSLQIKSQEVQCNLSVSNPDSIYTLGPNQVMCIDSLSTFSGSLILNGGTLINNGLSVPKLFVVNTGKLFNKGTFYYSETITINYNGVFANLSGAQFNTNKLIINGEFTNEGLVNIQGELINNIGTSQNNSIINANVVTGSHQILNNGIININ